MSHTIDFSSNWNEYSDEESDFEVENVLDLFVMSSECCFEDETPELFTNSN